MSVAGVVESNASGQSAKRFSAAIADLVEGARLRWLWAALAHQDMKLRYRGSLLGPFWQTLTTAVMVAGLGILYPRLFGVSTQTYLPMVAAGLVFWSFISGMILEGCKVFTDVQHILHVVRLPYSVHVYRGVYRNIFTLAHNFVIVPIVLILFPPSITWYDFLMLTLGFLAVAFNGIWITLLFGMFSARYRDVPPIIASVVQLLLFVTPIFWRYQQLGPDAWWVELNPFFAAIDVMRAPLLGEPSATYSWPVMLLLTAVGSGGTLLFFARFRSRIPFWV